MRIYLDHNATTPLHPDVLAAMERILGQVWGNPSSVHAEGAAARAELEQARARVAAALGAGPDEIVFTGCASESNNAALRSVAGRQGPGHIVSTTAEHPSVSEPLDALEAEGWRVTRVPVDGDGLVDPAVLAAALAEGADLLSILWANNETGVIQPLEALAGPARERGVPVHVDATQVLGKRPIDLAHLPIDLLSASGHKLNAAKGIGCLYVRRDRPWTAWLRGGPQERRRRGGTENVAGAVGLGVACAWATRTLAERSVEMAELRDRLWRGIEAKIPGVRWNGAGADLLPNTLSVEFAGADGSVLVEALDLEGVAVSAGAACASGSTTPSHVLAAMGRTPEQALGTLRFSVGLGVDAAQIDHVLSLLPERVEAARQAVVR